MSKHITQCLLCDYVQLEDRQQVRVVCQNEGFVALVPFWAVWPFEILVCSRRHLGTFPEFTDPEVVLLAQLLQQVTSTYDKVFDVPFPYSMGFHQSPTDGNPHHECAFPRALLSSASALCDHSKIHGGIRNAGHAATRHHSGKRRGTFEIADAPSRTMVILSGVSHFASEAVAQSKDPYERNGRR